MYHSIDSVQSPPTNALFTVTLKKFTEQMMWLAENRSQLHLIKFGQVQDEPSVGVTFDDGYADNLTQALPVLEKFEIPFCVFVISNEVKNRSTGFLSPEQLRQLAQHPLAQIGGHGQTHAPLAKLDPKGMALEISDSKKYLEDLLGHQITSFSYPHGSFNNLTEQQLNFNGYESAGTSIAGSNYVGHNPLQLRRMVIFNYDDFEMFKLKVSGHWDWYSLRHSVKKIMEPRL